MDEDNNPLPYVNVYIKLTDWGTTTDEKGHYFIDLDQGEYQVVFSAIGYETKEIQIVLRNNDVVKNVYLKPSAVQLNQVVVKAKRRDPAYEIIQNTIAHKDRWLKQYQSSVCDVYIKANEEIDERERKRRERAAKQAQEVEEEGARGDDEKEQQEIDPFAAKQQANMKLLASMNLVEVQLTRNYEYPNNIKEVRTGFEKYGSTEGLFFLTTAQANFNFYKSLVDVPKLSETPLISPLNRTSVVSYKFRLEETTHQHGHLVYKIKVTPRKQGNATWSGYIWIIDDLWVIKKLDLTLEKGNLILYDKFRIQQTFQPYGETDSVWVLENQTFDYYSKTKRREFTGKTVAEYTNWQLNVEFPKRFFKNELAVTTEEAYERDSTYWEGIRPKPLTKEEQEYIALMDSIEEAHNRKEFLDSVDAVYNKITFGKIAYWGVGHRVREKKKQYYIGSLLDWWEPLEVGGSRIGPYMSFFKKFEDQRWLSVSGGIDMGVRNSDLKGQGYVRYLYDPKKFAYWTASGGHNFGMINTFDAYLNMIRRSNFIEVTNFSLAHHFELVNGLYLYTGLGYAMRSPIDDLEFGDFMSDLLQDNDPLSFEGYEALISTVWLSYTINQEYMSEPHRKVVLGSRWPTLTLTYRKGWEGPLGSDVNFDQLSFDITQTIRVRTLGTSKYRIETGKFINTRRLEFVDYNWHRQSDPVLWSNPLRSFQLLDTTLTALDIYFAGHYIHHFNGALINNIPLVKKTRIKTVAGGGMLWDLRSNYQYVEAFVGVERVFKIQRQRFRLGIYGVAAESNFFNNPATGLKFSIEFFDNREGKWNF